MDTSIIIPVKDDEYIFLCLERLIAIKKKNEEIIVVNDSLSRGVFSKKLISFCKLNKIVYMRSKTPGAAFNRNEGMRIAKGKKLLFIDSDCLPDKNWIEEMEKSLDDCDLVEGSIKYDSPTRTVLDRSVENIETPGLFLTANLGIKKEVSKKCKFDERFIVFREDTDFGLSALEQGFKSAFNTLAIVFHKKSKFSIKRFIFERERYIGEPLLYKKHKENSLISNYVRKMGRIFYPAELLFLLLIFSSVFFSLPAFVIFYLFPGAYYLGKKYASRKYIWNMLDSIIVLILLPVTMLVKRIAIWKGALKFRILVI